ncbi:g12473 [Coccomyxa viridis]|uniref:G12473 protein n=1 Tax=Coccomyxa viridis TaxID=1274662 RepID=A0ABP1GFX2_9CHLO
MVSASASEQQAACVESRAAAAQQLSDEAGTANPALPAAAARRRLFRLRHRFSSAKRASSRCATDKASAGAETPRERAERIRLGFCAPRSCTGSKDMQPAAVAAPLPDHEGLKRQQEALVGRLIAEAGEAECIAADMQDQLQHLQCTKSTLEGDLQRERVDHWCLDVAKSGLQERVAAQAAAVVELEGLTEKLSLQCSDKAQTVQELKARIGTMQALLDASRAENQKLTDAQLLRLQRLERDLLLSQKDRRVREALEYAISVIRGSENTAHEGEGPRVGLRRSPSGGCWSGAFSRRSGSRSGSQDGRAAGQRTGSPPAQQEAHPSGLPSTLVTPRVSSFAVPATPGKTEGSSMRQRAREQSDSCASSLTSSPEPLSLARGDSAMTLPPKRRAMSDAALMNARLDAPSDVDLEPSAFSHTEESSTSYNESLRPYRHAAPGGTELRRSPTCPPQPSVSTGLGFAHSVTPHISKIGRQLAVQYAVNFESSRLRVPSQELASHDLELLCSPRQNLDQ